MFFLNSEKLGDAFPEVSNTLSFIWLLHFPRTVVYAAQAVVPAFLTPPPQGEGREGGRGEGLVGGSREKVVGGWVAQDPLPR